MSRATRKQRADLHNELASDVVTKIVKSTMQLSGEPMDILIVAQSVLVGLGLAYSRVSGEDNEIAIAMIGETAKVAQERMLLDGAMGGSA